MPLTPNDIHSKEFSRKFRGYDEIEVNEYLDLIIKDYELLIEEKQDLQKRMDTMQERLDQYNNIEETLSKTIIVAQETADELRVNAKREAQLIVREAEKNADRILNEALAKARKVSLENEELKKQAQLYRTRLKTMVEAQLELLNIEGMGGMDDEYLTSGDIPLGSPLKGELSGSHI
jgi:cell division initiation protein